MLLTIWEAKMAKSEQKCAEIRESLSVDLKNHYNYGVEYFIYF